MDNTIKKKLSVFRKRQTVFVIISEQVEQPWKVPDTAAMAFRI